MFAWYNEKLKVSWSKFNWIDLGYYWIELNYGLDDLNRKTVGQGVPAKTTRVFANLLVTVGFLADLTRARF